MTRTETALRTTWRKLSDGYVSLLWISLKNSSQQMFTGSYIVYVLSILHFARYVHQRRFAVKTAGVDSRVIRGPQL